MSCKQRRNMEKEDFEKREKENIGKFLEKAESIILSRERKVDR